MLELGMVVHTYNLSTWEIKARESWVQSQPELSQTVSFTKEKSLYLIQLEGVYNSILHSIQNYKPYLMKIVSNWSQKTIAYEPNLLTACFCKVL
jgi:hypothetical protein